MRRGSCGNHGATAHRTAKYIATQQQQQQQQQQLDRSVAGDDNGGGQLAPRT
jgi:hypothetical protein